MAWRRGGSHPPRRLGATHIAGTRGLGLGLRSGHGGYSDIASRIRFGSKGLFQILVSTRAPFPHGFLGTGQQTGGKGKDAGAGRRVLRCANCSCKVPSWASPKTPSIKTKPQSPTRNDSPPATLTTPPSKIKLQTQQTRAHLKQNDRENRKSIHTCCIQDNVDSSAQGRKDAVMW